MNPETLKRFDATLAEWAVRAAAEVDAAQGDERALGLAQLKKSLLEPRGMLASAGRLPGDRLMAVRIQIEARIESQRRAEDFDALERTAIQLALIDQTRALIDQLEADAHE